jgi:hypothetical protein
MEVDIKELLNFLGCEPKPVSGGLEFSCLFAKHTHGQGVDKNPSGFIKTSNVGYYCRSCGMQFPSLKRALFELYLLNEDAGLDNTRLKSVLNGDIDLDLPSHQYISKQTAPEPFIALTDKFVNSFTPIASPDAMKAREYLVKRSIPARVVKAFNIKFDASTNRVVVFYRNKEGLVAGAIGRSIDNSEPRYWVYSENNHFNSSIWFNEYAINGDKPLVVVEGIFDCLKVAQCYKNVVAIGTSITSSPKLSKLSTFNILWASDNDASGLLSRAKAREYYQGKTSFSDLFVPKLYKDFGDTPLSMIKRVMMRL